MAAEDVLVDVQNLVKTYGPLRAVNDLSFQIKRGEIVGLLGRNGAGKSTTMKVLTCYLVADGGTASVSGVSVDDDPVGVRKHIGYLPENAPLYPEMRVKDYLHFVAGVRGLGGSKRRERIDWSVEKCGLTAKFMSPISTLSRGYRQRVGLAQAVLHDPDLLILDEPTSGLDPIQLIEIRKLILEIGKTKTVLFSTHIMQEVEAVCNRALVIDKGQLKADDAPSKLRRQFGAQQKIVARLAGPTTLEAKTLIEAQKGIESVAVQHLPNGGWLECVVRLNKDADSGECGEALFGLARERGWKLQEVRIDAVSLEDAFLVATGYGEKKQTA